jgi:hypothetical protein
VRVDRPPGRRQSKAKRGGWASSLDDAQEEGTPGTPGPRRRRRPPGESAPYAPAEGGIPSNPFLTHKGEPHPPGEPDLRPPGEPFPRPLQVRLDPP